MTEVSPESSQWQAWVEMLPRRHPPGAWANFWTSNAEFMVSNVFKEKNIVVKSNHLKYNWKYQNWLKPSRCHCIFLTHLQNDAKNSKNLHNQQIWCNAWQIQARLVMEDTGTRRFWTCSVLSWERPWMLLKILYPLVDQLFDNGKSTISWYISIVLIV